MEDTIHAAPLIYEFASVLDVEAFDALVTRMFSRGERHFHLWGNPIPMGVGKVHVYGCETLGWRPVTLEVNAEGVVALGPADWYPRLMDELSRAIPCRAAWIGKEQVR